MKKFKKIYIEITNICNLKCSFCPQDNMVKKEMSLEEFEIILNKIKDYTDYIYLHVKGEPLTHSNLKNIIMLAKKYKFNINITTNGTLLKNKYKDIIGIRELNISLQSITDLSYLEDIFEVSEILSKETFIEYRLWTKNKYEKEILEAIKSRYNTLDNKLSKNIYFKKGEEFIWPSLSNDILRETGTCYGTRDQLGILVDGTVIPCCLDSKGIINLGNIFNNSLNEIINSKRFMNISKGFENNILCENLCKKCGFKLDKDL